MTGLMLTSFGLATGFDIGAFETRASVMKAMQGHILAKAVYGGLFKRPQQQAVVAAKP